MYPKFKVGDLVRSKWARGNDALGIVCSEDISESNIGTYYRIFTLRTTKKSGDPPHWDLVK